MKKLKKILMICLAFIFSIGCFTTLVACSNNNDNAKIKVVCTVYAEYDWTKEIIGDKIDNYELILLTNNGVDLHSYRPSVQDIAQISSCDLFIHVGGESEEAWIDNALENPQNNNRKVITLFDTLNENLLAEEDEGIIQEDEHEHEHEHEHEEENDEHVWLSLKNAKICVAEIAEQLANIDSANRNQYINNAKTYTILLDALDTQYEQVISEGTKDTILFADRFPFLYLVKDYNLNYFAAFKGCSADTEVTSQTITTLVEKVNSLELKVILKIESSDSNLATTIKEQSATKDQTILTVDSMQSTTITTGTSYLKIMAQNLNVLSEAVK